MMMLQSFAVRAVNYLMFKKNLHQLKLNQQTVVVHQ